MFKIDGIELDLNNLPASVKIEQGGYIEQIKDGVKTVVTAQEQEND